MLLIAHHAVLVERWDPLLRVLHDLRVRMVAVSPRRGNGAREDGPGSGMGLSGTRDTHLDEEAVLQRRDVLAVAADLRRSQSGASCVIPFPLHNPTTTRHRQPPKHPPRHSGTPDMPRPSWGRSRSGDVAPRWRVKPRRTPQPASQLTHEHPRVLGTRRRGETPQGLPPTQGGPTTPRQVIRPWNSPQESRKGKERKANPEAGRHPPGC